jgi:hypothetical protein
MKANHRMMKAALMAAILGTTPMHAQVLDEVKDKAKNPGEVKIDIEIDGDGAKADADGKAGTKLDGNGTTSHSESKSVSITSDGKKTIRKTVTTRNGVTEEKTEVLDGDGNVVDEEGDEAPQQQGQSKPAGVWIGAEVKAADPALREQLGLGPDEGVVIRTLANDGPAAKAGLKVNDILLKAGDQVLAEEEDLRSELRNHKAGDSLEVEYMRKGERDNLTVTIEERGQQQHNDGGGAQANGNQGGNSFKLEIDGAADLDEALNDPNVPESIKKQMKEMLEKMKSLQK